MLAAMARLPVSPGDALFVPAGTPHAIGAGILLLELQEPTDLSIMLEAAPFGFGEQDATLGLGWETALPALGPQRLRRRPARGAAPAGGPPAARRGRPVLPGRAPSPAGDRLDAGYSVLVGLDGRRDAAHGSRRRPLRRGQRGAAPPRRRAGRARRRRPRPALPAARPGGTRGPLVSRELLVGLDVGTTAVKAAVFDTDGAECADGRAPTPWQRRPDRRRDRPGRPARGRHRRGRAGAGGRAGGHGPRRRRGEHGRDGRPARPRRAPGRPVDRLARHPRRRAGRGPAGRAGQGGVRRAHRPARLAAVLAGEVPLDARPLARRRGRRALAERRRVDRARLRRRAGRGVLARHPHRLLRPAHRRPVGGGARLGRRTRRLAPEHAPAGTALGHGRCRRAGRARAAPCWRSAATTTCAPRSASARRARATCWTPAAPRRRGRARRRRCRPTGSRARSRRASRSAGTPSRAATRCSAPSAPAPCCRRSSTCWGSRPRTRPARGRGAGRRPRRRSTWRASTARRSS